jgi:type IV secretory pathway TraG/TraD family ATPase VirD4
MSYDYKQPQPKPVSKSDMDIEFLIFATITIFAPWVWYIFKKDKAAKSRFNNLGKRCKRLWSMPLTYWVYSWVLGYLIPLYLSPKLRADTHLNIFRVCENFIAPYITPWLGCFLKPFFFMPSCWQPVFGFLIFAVLVPEIIICAVYSYVWKRERYFEAQEIVHHTNLILPTTGMSRGAPIVIKIPMSDCNAGTLVLGTTNSGKTQVIYTIVYQLPREPEDPILFFDPKWEYYRYFSRHGDIALGLTNSTHSWNIFLEAESEDDFDEISAELFAGSEIAGDRFWTESAQQSLAAILKLLYREGKKQGILPTNEDLVRFINSKETSEIYELLREHEDLRSVAQYFSPKIEKQAGSVKSTLSAKFNQIFVGDFKRSDKPAFSIREYMQNPNGKALFLIFDITKSKTIAPIYRLLVDTAAKYAIQPGSEWHKKFFIIDEMQHLPHLEKYQPLVNTGRTYYVWVVAGIQSIAQLNAAYGKNVAEAILSGNKYMILLRSGDRETTNFIRAMLGRFQRKQVTHHGVPGAFGGYEIEETTHVTEESPASEQEVQTLEPGECFIIMRGKWLRTRLLTFEKSKEYVDNAECWLEREKERRSKKTP